MFALFAYETTAMGRNETRELGLLSIPLHCKRLIVRVLHATSGIDSHPLSFLVSIALEDLLANFLNLTTFTTFKSLASRLPRQA